jgi:hypothetical protein
VALPAGSDVHLRASGKLDTPADKAVPANLVDIALLLGVVPDKSIANLPTACPAMNVRHVEETLSKPMPMAIASREAAVAKGVHEHRRLWRAVSQAPPAVAVQDLVRITHHI